MELVKTAIKVGNSAGVLLPREWLNSQVRVVLQPLNIERDILEILAEERILENSRGVYIIGSYARNEQNIDSDVDVLAITSSINKRIKRGKYEVICVPKDEVEMQLRNNALPILAMIKEAKAVINEELIKKYSGTKLNRQNIKWHIETTKTAMKVAKKGIEISRELGRGVGDGIAYSLILRLRTLYIIRCIRKNKMWSKREFLRLVKKVGGSALAYERYLSSKNKNTLSEKLPAEEAEKIMDYINKGTKELENG